MSPKLLLFIGILTIGASLRAQSIDFIPAKEIIVTNTKNRHLLKQCSRPVPSNVKSYWVVDSLSLRKLHENFLEVLQLKWRCCTGSGGSVEDLNLYAYQVVGVTVNSRKFIYINAFPIERFEDSDKDYLSKSLLDVCDGGPDFWGVLFDVATCNFKDLIVNGGG